MIEIEIALAAFASFMWGPPMVVLLVGGGLFFMLHSRMQHFRYIGHSLDLLHSKYSEQSGDAAGVVDTYLPVSEKDLAARKAAMLSRLDYCSSLCCISTS